MADFKTDYLIIGNSAAGISAAEQIRLNSLDSSVLIVGDEPYKAYGRPLISYMIEGKTTKENIYINDDQYYERNNFDLLLGRDGRISKINASAHSADLENGKSIEYKKCLVATGSVPFNPPIEGMDGAKNVFNFMTLDDALGLWEAAKCLTEKKKNGLKDETRIVVVGAGLIGLKAAEAISTYADEVVVLELAPRILPAVLDEQGAKILQNILAEHNIKCFPTISASKFIREDNTIVAVELTDGQLLDCDIVVSAVGVRPNTSLAEAAGALVERGLVCDGRLQTTLEDVYAAGDVVQVTDILDGAKHPLALWPNAIQQGRLAGRFMSDDSFEKSYEGGFAVNAVDFFDANLLTSGTINPPADEIETGKYQEKIYVQDNKYAKFVTKDGKLAGYILLNRPENAGIYTSIIENSTPIEDIGEEIFLSAPQNVNLTTEHRWQRLHKGYPCEFSRLGTKEN